MGGHGGAGGNSLKRPLDEAWVQVVTGTPRLHLVLHL